MAAKDFHHAKPLQRRATMVCSDCEKKLSKVIVPDKWKAGARNTTGGADGSYSCNVSATGVEEGGEVKITKLSCAKDEGWGRTIDLF